MVRLHRQAGLAMLSVWGPETEGRGLPHLVLAELLAETEEAQFGYRSTAHSRVLHVKNLVLLDFDGVIADSFEMTTAATISAMKASGFVHLASPDIVVRLSESNWFEGLRKLGLPPKVSDDVDAIVAEATIAGEFGPFAGMPTLIARLADHHPVLIVTSNRGSIVESFLERWRISGVSDVLGGENGESKVCKIREIVCRYGQGGKTWFVGDTSGDVIEGRKAGAGTIAVTWGWHALEQLKGALPDHIVDTPAELLALLL